MFSTLYVSQLSQDFCGSQLPSQPERQQDQCHNTTAGTYIHLMYIQLTDAEPPQTGKTSCYWS